MDEKIPSQLPLPESQRGAEPIERRDPDAENLNNRVENGFARSAAKYNMTVQQVQSVVKDFGTRSSEVFQLIEGGMSLREAIAKVEQG